MIDPEDFEKSKKNYLIAIDIKDDFAEAHFQLGKLLSKGLQNDESGTLVIKPDYDNSIFHLEKAIKIKKDFVEAFYYLGMIQRINNNHGDSLKHLKTALKIDEKFSKAHFEIAMLYKDMINVNK